MPNGRLFLIDGHALIFKMYYAFMRRPMINSKGVDTSILFGFTKYLLELIEKEKPSHLAVAFDPPGGTFRNEMFPAYKANRPPTPQLVIDALEPLTELCGAMNIPVLMIRGFEADDVIGSMAKRSASEGLSVYMVTPDKDYGQLIADGIYQYKPGKNGADAEVLGVKEICEKYNILDPVQVIDMLAICGDSADNVPGVNGVGEVGASKLVSKYGSVENIYAHLDELSEKQRAMFEAAGDHIALSKRLVTIKTDIALDTTADQMVLDRNYSPRISELFSLYEFNSLRRYISHVPAPQPGAATAPGAPAAEFRFESATPAQVMQAARTDGNIALYGSSDSLWAAALRHGAMRLSETGELLPGTEDTVIVCSGNAAALRDLLTDASVAKCGHCLKKLLRETPLEGRLLDIELMHYLLNPERSHELSALALQFLGVSLDEPAGRDEAPRALSLFDDDADETIAPEDHSREAAAILSLSGILSARMEQDGVRKLYDNIEEPLIRVLARMEGNGVKVDVLSLREFADGLREEIARKEALVREIAGEPELNVSSPKQIGEVIFEKLKLDPRAKKPAKGSWSTDEETLTALSDRSPIIDAILEYRAAKKLLSTYIEPFPGYISPVDGRVHTTFNQALTATGRLSSSNPNLQNIPIRTERGRLIRKAFVPGEAGCVIMSADYSQIELRIMAHLCGDAHLIEAFNAGVDVHAATAAKIFGVPVAEVSADQRRVAKTANFGIMYGISSFGLAQRLKISRAEAKKIIDDYFASFPSISDFIEKTKVAARERGYVETLFGRRRYIADINSHNANLRALAERNAVNAPIQGSSADIIKLAMIGVDRRMREQGLRSRMVLQIHDELVFEVPSDEISVMQALVVSEMENVMSLSVPLTVECKYGNNWLEAH